MLPHTISPTSTSTRDRALRESLLAQRHQLLQATRSRMDDVRDGADEAHEVRDEAEIFEADMRTDLELALVEMQRETLAKIDAALTELDEGTYGRCRSCGAEIATRRLQALPFAVRCKTCEDRREEAEEMRPIPAERLWPRGRFSEAVA